MAREKSVDGRVGFVRTCHFLNDRQVYPFLSIGHALMRRAVCFIVFFIEDSVGMAGVLSFALSVLLHAEPPRERKPVHLLLTPSR